MIATEIELATWLQNRLNKGLAIDEWQRPLLEKLVTELMQQ